MYELEITLY